MKSNKVLQGALVASAAMLPLSQSAQADVNISGWINEALTWYDDGLGSDIVQNSDNGTTLGSRITLSGSTDVGAGLTAGFEVILEPTDTANILGFGSSGVNEDQNAHDIGVLGNSLNIGGAWGKVTVGLQTMPTDNIAVLADPSLTLWSTISPVFRGNGQQIQGAPAGATWGSFLQCLTVPGLGIGIDCNGIYRSGIRYDLPAFGPVSVAVGYANDDVYDIAVKYSGNIGRMTANVHGGYAINNGGGGSNVGATESETFQIQAGLMDSVTGLFGLVTYQTEEADGATVGSGDDTDAYWIKAGIKKAFTSLGDTALSIQYGSYNDQYGSTAGITGSEVERIGFSVDQYFGSSLIIYGVYEQLDLEVDGPSAALYSGAEEFDSFTLGGTFFF